MGHANEDVIRGYGRTGGTFRIEPHDPLANERHGVALSKAYAERDGNTMSWNVITVYRVADGKLPECWIHDCDEDVAAEALA